jgi:hypothetical protein
MSAPASSAAAKVGTVERPQIFIAVDMRLFRTRRAECQRGVLGLV